MNQSRNILRPQKSLGQHFLRDQNILKKIITACDLRETDTVLEIGPGPGVLTRELAPRVKRLVAVEKDKALAQILAREFTAPQVTVTCADILKYDITALGQGLKVVGNLPYYISTPIIEKIIEARSCLTTAFFTVQREFGQRLTAAPHTKDYGALTCFVQYYTVPRLLFAIKPNAFTPAPKVHSCFLRFDFAPDPAGDRPRARNEKRLFQIIRAAFQQRRKTIANSLSVVMKKDTIAGLLANARIDPQARAEDLALSDFIRLADLVHEK